VDPQSYFDVSCECVIAASVEENVFENLKVYPNPTNGTFQIEMHGIIQADLLVFDASGKLIFSEEGIQDPVRSFDLDLQPGVYILELKTSETMKSVRLIVN
jgi:hypothetical protein